MAPGASWPSDQTEPAVRAELGDASFPAPAVVVRGKPEGTPVCNVFLVDAAAAQAAETAAEPDGTLYEDDPDSPIVILGDSFTGVYELMDCEHAGVSAHIAKEIGYPGDLLMSYGGGPNVTSCRHR